jgi:hypothetical protein
MDKKEHAGNSVLLEEIRQVLSQSSAPLSPAALNTPLKQKSGKALKPILDQAVREGQIYKWATDLYWDRDPNPLARERLLAMSASEALPSGALCKQAAAGVAKPSLSVARTALKDLTSEGKLRLLNPPAGTKSKTKIVVNVASPQPYLELGILGLLAQFDVARSREQVRIFLADGTSSPQPIAPSRPDVNAVAGQMFDAINRIAFAHGTTVTFHRLRQEPELAAIPKEIFDASALLLQAEYRALLNPHGFALAIPAEERAQLVTDGRENYYVSIYAR